MNFLGSTRAHIPSVRMAIEARETTCRSLLHWRWQDDPLRTRCPRRNGDQNRLHKGRRFGRVDLVWQTRTAPGQESAD